MCCCSLAWLFPSYCSRSMFLHVTPCLLCCSTLLFLVWLLPRVALRLLCCRTLLLPYAATPHLLFLHVAPHLLFPYMAIPLRCYSMSLLPTPRLLPLHGCYLALLVHISTPPIVVIPSFFLKVPLTSTTPPSGYSLLACCCSSLVFPRMVLPFPLPFLFL